MVGACATAVAWRGGRTRRVAPPISQAAALQDARALTTSGGRRWSHARAGKERGRSRLSLKCQSDQSSSAAVTGDSSFITVQEIKAAAESRGLTLSMTTFGPFFKVLCRRRNSQQTEVTSNDPDVDKDILGDAAGFFAPWFGILHLDSLRIFNSRIKKLGEGEGEAKGIQSPFGVGLLVGALAVRSAYDFGCTKAELLAIKDNDKWHMRLVKYYSRLGFKSVREVGDNGISDFPHLVVWGGAGTRMDADIASLCERWSVALRYKQPEQ